LTRILRCKQASEIDPKARRRRRLVAESMQMQEKPVLFGDIDGAISLWIWSRTPVQTARCTMWTGSCFSFRPPRETTFSRGAL
jgi:hypothetical protein